MLAPPPQVVASDGKRSAILTDPDPVIKAVNLQNSVPISWQEPDGKTSTGILTLPPGFRRGSAVPLVIHAYFVRPELFLPDGTNRAVEAGQALAARGIAVLMMEMPLPAQTDKERAVFVARIDAAVGQLAREGIVDPTRVGITGFSHAGYLVLNAITHPGQVHLAAAVGADFFAGTYSSYLTEASFVSQSSLGAYERAPGGSFWDRRSEWSQEDSTFNADRVLTPFLITYHGFNPFQRVAIRKDLDAVLGIIGAFMRNDKPVDYLYMAHSEHELSRPLERLAATGAMLDWMAFWLQGYEDPSPHKALQYQRWRPMRQQQTKSAAQAKLGERAQSNFTKSAALESPVRSEAARQALEEMAKAGVVNPGNEMVLNNLGYQALYGEGDVQKALSRFRWNLALFPDSRLLADLHDSMAEAYVQAGDIGKAMEYYQKALAISSKIASDPKAADHLNRLKTDPAQLSALQAELRAAYGPASDPSQH